MTAQSPEDCDPKSLLAIERTRAAMIDASLENYVRPKDLWQVGVNTPPRMREKLIKLLQLFGASDEDGEYLWVWLSVSILKYALESKNAQAWSYELRGTKGKRVKAPNKLELQKELGNLENYLKEASASAKRLANFALSVNRPGQHEYEAELINFIATLSDALRSDDQRVISYDARFKAFGLEFFGAELEARASKVGEAITNIESLDLAPGSPLILDPQLPELMRSLSPMWNIMRGKAPVFYNNDALSASLKNIEYDVYEILEQSPWVSERYEISPQIFRSEDSEFAAFVCVVFKLFCLEEPSQKKLKNANDLASRT